MLDRLATASSVNVDEIWRSLSSILSDLCKVNKDLALEIQTMIGSNRKPMQ